jgi:cyclic pyranopterin monophosphate synthase
MKNKLTHIDDRGQTRMVNVSGKAVTLRRAIAEGRIRLTKAIVNAIQSQSIAKGNVLETARIGAIQAAKKTSELIPLCHPIPISNISIDFRFQGINLKVRTEVIAEAKTGVEMEALVAGATGLLIVYDMCKGIDKGMIIGPIELLKKEGGKSGTYRKKR